MKRFARRQEDIQQPRQPKLSEIVTAIEDAWGRDEFPYATVTIKNGDIRVKYGENRSASYRCEPKLRFSDGFYYWTVESWGAPQGRKEIVVGTKMPSSVSTCTVPHMGDFYGRLEDIVELEVAIEEVRKAYAKIQDLVDSEVEQ